MAETAGLALAVFSAFNDAIQCFDYIYLARNFDRDSQSALLKFDIAKLRLSRWGRSVGLDPMDGKSPEISGISASPKECEKAKERLAHISRLFDEAENKSAQWKKDRGDPVAADFDGVLDPATRSLHKRLVNLASKNFQPRSLLQEAKWGLHSEKHVRRLVEDIKETLDGLLELFPAAQHALKKLYEEEGQELAHDENVGLLQPLVAEEDPDLNDAIEANGKTASQTYNAYFGGSTNYGLQQGSFTGSQTNNFGQRQQ